MYVTRKTAGCSCPQPIKSLGPLEFGGGTGRWGTCCTVRCASRETWDCISFLFRSVHYPFPISLCIYRYIYCVPFVPHVYVGTIVPSLRRGCLPIWIGTRVRLTRSWVARRGASPPLADVIQILLPQLMLIAWFDVDLDQPNHNPHPSHTLLLRGLGATGQPEGGIYLFTAALRSALSPGKTACRLAGRS